MAERALSRRVDPHRSHYHVHGNVTTPWMMVQNCDVGGEIGSTSDIDAQPLLRGNHND